MANAIARNFAIAAIVASVAALNAAPASAQGKPWRHALIDAKADAGFFMMAAQQGLRRKAGAQDRARAGQGRPDRHQGAARRRGRQLRGRPARRDSRPRRAAPTSRSSAATGWRCRTASSCATGITHDRRTSRARSIAVSSPGTPPDIVARASLAMSRSPARRSSSPPSAATATATRRCSAGVVDAAVVSNEYTPVAAEEPQAAGGRQRGRCPNRALLHA